MEWDYILFWPVFVFHNAAVTLVNWSANKISAFGTLVALVLVPITVYFSKEVHINGLNLNLIVILGLYLLGALMGIPKLNAKVSDVTTWLPEWLQGISLGLIIRLIINLR